MRVALALVGIACVALAACYVWYFVQETTRVRRAGTVIGRELVPAHTVKEYQLSRSHVTSMSGPTASTRDVPDCHRYEVKLDSGETVSVVTDCSNDPFRKLSAEIGERVIVQQATRWTPVFGTWILSELIVRESDPR